MIVKIIILRLLVSSDDKEKEKIGVARPEGPPLWGSVTRLADGGRGGAAPRGSQGLRSEAPEEPTHEASVHPTLVGRTDATMIGAGGNQSQVSL